MGNNNILNFSNMKHANRLLVLNMLLKNGQMSRADIARELKCDGTTITHIIRDMLEKDMVKSAGMREIPGGGRPKELITLNPESRQVIGISVEPPYITGIIAGLTGKINFCEKIYLGISISSEELAGIFRKLVASLISRIDRKKLLGIGVATFGVLSPENRKVIDSRHFPAIEDLDFVNMFQDEFNIMPEIIDGSYAKALAEISLAESDRKHMKNFMLLDIGAGIALLNICSGTPVVGANGYLGEFGHTIITPDGEKCYCGRKGCLETQCSIPAIEREVSAVLEDISFDKIVSLYKQGEKRVEKIVNNSAMILGNVTGNMLTVLPTDEIIFTGRLLEFGDKYLAVLEEGIRKTAFPLFMKKTRILKSRNPEENAALGACSIILNSFFEGNSPDLKNSRQS